MSKFIIVALLLSIFVINNPIVVAHSVDEIAAENASTNTSAKNSYIKEKQTKYLEILKQKCGDVQVKLDKLSIKLDESYPKHINTYNKISEKLNILVAKLKDNKKDTTKLEADIQTLKSKVQIAQDNYQGLTDLIAVIKNTACGNSQGNFAALLEDARTHLAELRTALNDVKAYWSTTIKADVAQFKNK
jgi:DNA repair exonuclease SbcCD ATPase subunit